MQRDRQRRSFSTATLTLDQLRRIGNWGGASRSIGRRWELLGVAALRQGVARPIPCAVVSLCDDGALQARLSTLGLPNPDVLAVEAATGDEATGRVGDGATLDLDAQTPRRPLSPSPQLASPVCPQLIVRPVDLKWALDVASYRQISGQNLDQLMAADPSLLALVQAALPAGVADQPPVPADGYFFCPDSTANRRFFASPENRRQEYPLEAHEVVFAPVEVEAFFGALPGWTTGREMARLDGSVAALRYLDTADRYYHLGAGVNGALVVRTRSVFVEEEVDCAGDELARFRTFAAEVRPLTTGEVITRLDAEMRRRRELQQRVRALRRCPYTFEEFADDVRAMGLGEEDSAVDRGWGQRYGEIASAHAAAIMQAGRTLVAAGHSDAQALAALEHRVAEFATRARVRARAMLALLQSPEARHQHGLP
ncbi:MAG: hypothetical protein HYY04_04135 [Chloroflexi bacterium]|nr:hypothetical protein [Chloroflexota bacterium]